MFLTLSRGISTPIFSQLGMGERRYLLQPPINLIIMLRACILRDYEEQGRLKCASFNHLISQQS